MAASPVLRTATPIEDTHKVILYSYWRSSCSWRVRIALHFKNIPFETRTVNLLQNQQSDAGYDVMNPSHLLPTLMIDGNVLTQSIAILEYLEDRKPETWRLLPMEASERAQIRAMVSIIASDIQPIQNLRVMNHLVEEVGKCGGQPAQDTKAQWAHHWITTGFEALERMLKTYSGKFCYGDHVSLADVCLVPQVYNARRFGVDMTRFPNISRIEATLSEMEPFRLAHPDNQPDAPNKQ